MQLTILGSGGALAIPRPLCSCDNCNLAREKGIPYSRTGPSMIIEDEGILFDTPEEIRQQIECENIKKLQHVFLTHWHPDHTLGSRILEHIGCAYPDEQQKPPVDLYLQRNAMDDYKKYCPSLFFFEQNGWVNIHIIDDRKPISLGKYSITPIDFKRPDRVRYGYLIESEGKKAFYAPCSIYQWQIDEFYYNLDLLMMETGWPGDTLETRKSLPVDHAWQSHISFEENLLMVKILKPKMTILTHIEGTRHLTTLGNHDLIVEELNKYPPLNIHVAYDGMKIKI